MKTKTMVLLANPRKYENCYMLNTLEQLEIYNETEITPMTL